jgi:fibronectin type 3 domain-containing protein
LNRPKQRAEGPFAWRRREGIDGGLRPSSANPSRRAGCYSVGTNPPFKKGGSARRILIVAAITFLLFSNLFPIVSISVEAASSPESSLPSSDVPATSDDITVGIRSANLTVVSSTNKYKVLTEEYAIWVDSSTNFVEYQIRPYFSSDYIRYKRANPQYAGEGTIDQYGNQLDQVQLTVTNYGKDGNTVWFLESCPEFSIKQSFDIYRDYFELNATYKPGTEKVLTTYYIGLCSKTNSLYNLMSSGHVNRYVPGYAEDRTEGQGLGGWYPSLWMFAPACDMRVPGSTMGVEWGYSDTVAYLYSPLWLAGGGGGASIFALKYFAMNSVAPNLPLSEEETFHMFVRPYKYTDGKDHGYDVGYAGWASKKIADKWGNHNQAIFPLTLMNTATWSSSLRSWVESSKIKLATYSENPSQFDWNYKAAQVPNLPDGFSVPSEWEILKSDGAPMLFSDGTPMCNPVSGPYTESGTYRWQLINNDPYMDWWTSSGAVFWDAIRLWDANNKLKSDYHQWSEFIYDGYLKLMQDTYASSYWDYVVGNSFTGLLHLAIVTDLTMIEGYYASSVYGTDLTKHVRSTMNFVNNIPTTYRPKLLVVQNYAAGNADDQLDVYGVLFDSAKYDFYVDLLSYDSYDSQLHNLRMAEDMYKAMGCTRDSSARTVSVATLDLSSASTLTTTAGMVVTKGMGTPTITHTSPGDKLKLTNLHSSAVQYNLAFQSANLYQAGTNFQTSSPMTFTTDGKGTYHGILSAEKTGEVIKNTNVMVAQHNTGSTSVSLVSYSSQSAKLNLASTGGTTAIVLKGMKANTAFDIFVDSAKVATVTSMADGTLSFERAYGASDVLEIKLSSGDQDNVPPTVTSCLPANGATGVSVGAQITLGFSEDVNKSSVEAAFSLTDGSSPVSGTFSWASASSVSFKPSSQLAYSTSYQIKLATSAKDLAGNVLTSTFSSQFTTTVSPDNTPPTVTSCSPANGATGIGIGTGVSIVFSEGMDEASVESAFSLEGAGAPVSGSFSWSSTSAMTFTPSSSLLHSTDYVIELSTSAKDLAGNAMASSFSSKFSTAASPPPPPPTPVPPSSPTSLVASGGVRQISLSWSAPFEDGGASITGYNVYRSSAASGTYSLLASLSVASQYFDKNLGNGATYYYRVSALNSAGEGALSASVSAQTSSPPGPPLSLSATPSFSDIKLTWGQPLSDGGSGITGYKIYRGTSPGAETYLASVGKVLTYDDAQVVNGQVYYYVVSAVNAVGISASSNEISAIPGALPSSPQYLMGTPGDKNVLLTWESPSNDGGALISSYYIYKENQQGDMARIASVNATSYLDEDLTNGVYYFYAVSAVNSAGEGAVSSIVSVKPYTVPSAPTNLSAIGGNTEIKLTWSSPSSDGGDIIVGYKIYRAAAQNGWTYLTQIGALTEYLDSGLDNGARYKYLVTAVNEAGEGPASNEATATTTITPPSSPTNFLVTAGQNSAALEWQPPSENGSGPVIAYNIYRGCNSSELELIATVNDSLSFLDQDLVNGLTYWYGITAVNQFKEGIMTKADPVVPMWLPSPPERIGATVEGTNALISWTPPLEDNGSAIIGYWVYEWIREQWTRSFWFDASTYDYVVHGLAPASHHLYLVRAVNQVGEGPGKTVEFTAPDVPGQPSTLTIKEGVHNITIGWSTPSSDGGTKISTYVIYRSEEGAPFRIIILVPASVHSFLDEGLTANSTYRYYVKAMNVMGTGASSDVAQATVLPIPNQDGGHSTVTKNWAGTYQGALILSGTVVVGLFLTIALYYFYRRKGGSGVVAWLRSWSK